MANIALVLNLSNSATSIVKKLQSQSLITHFDRKYLVRNPHVTVGYIKDIEAELVGSMAEDLTKYLDQYLLEHPLVYEPENIAVYFENHTVITPSPKTTQALMALNATLEQYVAEIYRFSLNDKTTSQGYTPHLTLFKKKVSLEQLIQMNTYLSELKESKKHRRLGFKLLSSRFVVHQFKK
jgi:2'-5' RNA ligase